MAKDPKAALSAFKKLTEFVYISDPETDSTNNSNGPPILLAFWMNAGPRPVARYISEYRRMLPSSRIVILFSATKDFLVHYRDAAQDARLPHAVDALRDLATPANPAFIHVFSNGGVFKTAHLLRNSLPVSSMIVDSAPGIATVASGMKAIAFQLPRFWIWRLLSKTVLWMFLLTLEVIRRITRMPRAMDVASRRINDKRLYQAPAKGLARCYIYSDADQIISSDHVEDHIKESESCGIVVRREKFQGADHVMAMKMDSERYWAIVKDYLPLESPSKDLEAV
ncbi:hypothetical protein N7493_005440 [Penicillium malachiteum]|uniref:Indole-diterpene biosynthesis protein PaxU n=1 Tax=Penicillium malachiteum TaxID=1324776 RepID=A0AAD6MWI1_9EURO|nr:hypothetical protein N7493_005440 [Penicillium malachiteum]